MVSDKPEVKATETKEEDKTEAKPMKYEGSCIGKYKFDDDHKLCVKPVEVNQGAAITAYSWSDIKKRRSIHMEMDGVNNSLPHHTAVMVAMEVLG